MPAAQEESMTSYAAGFRDLKRELFLPQVPVQGQLPPWLRGQLLRTGPARYDLGKQRYRHWFDGLAALHSFTLGEDGVAYRCRFVESPDFSEADRDGKIGFPAFASDPCRGLFRRVMSCFVPDQTANPNVSVVRCGERWAAFTETPMPVEFDPDTLATLGVIRYPDKLRAQLSGAHPVPRGDALVNLQVHFGPRSAYQVVRQTFEKRELLHALPSAQPSYQHSFAMQGEDLIFTESPFRVNPLQLLLRDRPFIENYRWHSDQPTWFHHLELSSGRHQRFEAEPLFCFHHVGLTRRGDDLLLDLIAYPDAEIISSLGLERLKRAEPIPAGVLRRYALREGKARLVWEAPGAFELPRRDPRPQRPAVYGVGVADDTQGDMYNQLVRHHPHAVWRQPGCYPGEPVVVHHGDQAVALSVVLDGASGCSFLLVLDADSWTERARAQLPQAVPLGFHGEWASLRGEQT